MNQTIITLKKREIALKFTVDAWEQMENEVCILDELDARMASKGRLRVIAALISILSQYSAGPALTQDEAWALLCPANVKRASDAIAKEVVRAMKMENEDDGDGGDGGVVDVVLEEIEKNGNAAG